MQSPFMMLVVDDEPDLQFLITRTFKPRITAGELSFVFAGNGVEALEQIRQHPEIGVATIDIAMPVMDGWTLLERLQGEYPFVCPIVVTAYGDLTNIRKAMNRGAFDFLTKPINMADLETTLDKAIQHNCQLRANHRQYHELAEHAADGLVVVQDRNVVFMNAAAGAIFGNLPEQVLLSVLLPNETREAAEGVEAWQASRFTQAERDCWLATRRSAISWNGQPATLITIRDITAQKHHEQMLELKEQRLLRENQALQAILNARGCFGKIVGQSPAIQEVCRLILVAAANHMPALISGESGTGKELVATTIHELSDRRGKPCIPVNCAALTETLFESELFGHVKGAFTGAVADKPGLFERAHQGTLFLDEIAEMSLDQQVKLLRVLESGEYTPVGGRHVKRADVRLIAATNRDLVDMVRAGTFREDLFYRIHALEIRVPPLRERLEDLPLLLAHFLEDLGQPGRVLPDDVFRQLQTHSWPGNIRELYHVLSRYLATGTLSFANIRGAMPAAPPVKVAFEGQSLNDVMEQTEQAYITQMLERCHWQREETAAVLGISSRDLRRKIAKYNLIPPYQRKPARERKKIKADEIDHFGQTRPL